MADEIDKYHVDPPPAFPNALAWDVLVAAELVADSQDGLAELMHFVSRLRKKVEAYRLAVSPMSYLHEYQSKQNDS